MLSCLAGLIAMFGAPALTQNVTPVALRVMTYNIQYGGGDIERTSAVIRAAGPDLVALQEVDVHWGARSEFVDQASRLAERLGMQVRFAPIYRLPGADSASPSREFGVALRSRHQGTSFTNRLLARLRDSWPVAAGPGFTYPAVEPTERIDYVLLSPQFRVVAARVSDTKASDHRSVVVDVILASPRR